MFSAEELKRYTRQMMMDKWGEETQAKLKNSTIFIAGAGGLGSPVSIYLAVAGIGNMRICDFDSPDWSNLNRQILHNHDRVGTNKAISAKQTLSELNPHINITAFPTKIVSENVDELVGDASIIVDCMDNFPTRYLLNECAIRKKIPMVYGSIWGMEGRLSFLNPPETPGVIGTLQALEVIKYLTGIGNNLKSRILVWEGMSVEFKKYKAYKDPQCPVCSTLK